MKEMKASEKVAQKMTHDGAVTENLVTGEVERISSGSVKGLQRSARRKRAA